MEVKSTFLHILRSILAPTAIFSGSEQSASFHRVGKMTTSRLRRHLNDTDDTNFVAYIWQTPAMLLKYHHLNAFKQSAKFDTGRCCFIKDLVVEIQRPVPDKRFLFFQQINALQVFTAT